MGALDGIQFFGAVDRVGKREDGRIASEYPAFYFPSHRREMEEEVDKLRRSIELNLIPASEVPYSKAQLKRSEKRLDEIKNSVPKFTPAQKDELGNLYMDLQKQVSDSMFSRTDMKKGLVDVHEEARRMTEPIINVDKKHATFFRNHGITPVKGKITRNQAAKIYKIAGRVLDANTNVERLRRDNKTGVTKFEKSLEELFQEG